MSKSNVKTELDPPSLEEIERGRADVIGELNSAQAALDAAQYNVALHRGKPEYQSALTAAQQRVTNLKLELLGLEAVGREAQRRERASQKHVEIEALHALEGQAEAAADAVVPAWERVRKAIAELGVAHAALKQVAEAARFQTIRCNSDGIMGSTLLTLPHVERELMLATVGKELDVGEGVTSRSADYFEPAIAAIVENSKRLIRSGVQAKLEVANAVPVDKAA